MRLELELLAELRAALSEHEIMSELNEDFTGLKVTTATPGSYLWVFVNLSGRYFSWDRADRQHPVKDVAGAARRLAARAGQIATPHHRHSNQDAGRGHFGCGGACGYTAVSRPEVTGDA